uniref:Gustatory receptor n=2 Tax=Schizaphis graminum TaxID=13262 RepID=A0A2S2NUW8_SCHGA
MFIISLWLNQTITIIIYILMPFHLKGLRKVFKLFNTFFKCHGSIIGDKNTINMIARNTNIESIMMIIMNTVLSIVSVTTSFNRIRLSFAWKLLIMIDNVIHKFEALSLCIQFWCMCSMLAKCFKCLNVSLDRLRVRKNQVTIRPPGLFTMSDRLTLPTNMVIHLRKLNRAHTDLCFILDRINDVYQVLILLSIINCILNMLPHLFVLGIIMAYSNFRITPQISMVIWPLHYMIRVYILCKAASLASNEARRTKTILNTAFDKRLTDDEKKGVEYFYN